MRKFYENNHNPKPTNSWIKWNPNNTQKHRNSKEEYGKSYLSPPPPKGLWWDTKRLFIYLFIYYPIEDKHELWGMGMD